MLGCNNCIQALFLLPRTCHTDSTPPPPYPSNINCHFSQTCRIWIAICLCNAAFPAPVVQRVDNFTQRISRYPADKFYWLEYILSTGQTYPLFNTWGSVCAMRATEQIVSFQFLKRQFSVCMMQAFRDKQGNYDPKHNIKDVNLLAFRPCLTTDHM